MNILFYHHNRFIRDELQEFIDELEGKAYFAETVESAIRVLNRYPIGIAFLEIRSFFDIGLLQYINQNFQNLRIVLVVENEFEKMISAIREGQYGMARAPLGLGEIEQFISRF